MCVVCKKTWPLMKDARKPHSCVLSLLWVESGDIKKDAAGNVVEVRESSEEKK